MNKAFGFIFGSVENVTTTNRIIETHVGRYIKHAINYKQGKQDSQAI